MLWVCLILILVGSIITSTVNNLHERGKLFSGIIIGAIGVIGLFSCLVCYNSNASLFKRNLSSIQSEYEITDFTQVKTFSLEDNKKDTNYSCICNYVISNGNNKGTEYTTSTEDDEVFKIEISDKDYSEISRLTVTENITFDWMWFSPSTEKEYKFY